MITPSIRTWQALIQTERGQFIAQYTANGLCSLDFPNPRAESSKLELTQLPPQIASWHRDTQKALAESLAGHCPARLPALDLSGGTHFQQSVWRQMLKIPWGQTSTYAELASALGRPKAVRAVGGACGANPIPVLVPCHRVLAAGKRLGGFSAGLEWKRTLLKLEGGAWNEC